MKQNKKQSAINKQLNKDVVDEIKKITINIIQTNKMIDKFKIQIDDFYNKITQNTEDFRNQRVLNNKISSIQRLLYATKMGLDRQKIRIYDIDENAIKEEIIKGM